MLPKQRRIRRKEFPYILKNGKRFSSPHLLLYIAPKEKQNPSCFSFSISKKIYKHAVDRNIYRRRGYSIISRNLNNIMNGLFVFFVFKNGTYPISFDTLSHEVLSLLTEARVLR